MDLQVSEQQIFREAQEMALHLRLLEKCADELPGRVRAEVAEQARQAADEYAEDGDPAGARALRWFASLLSGGAAEAGP